MKDVKTSVQSIKIYIDNHDAYFNEGLKTIINELLNSQFKSIEYTGNINDYADVAIQNLIKGEMALYIYTYVVGSMQL